MQNLHGDFATLIMHPRRYGRMIGNIRLAKQPRRTGHYRAFFIGGHAAGHNQPYAALGPRAVKRRHAAPIPRLLQPRMHRPHQHAVAQGGKAKIKRFEKVRVCHRLSFASLAQSCRWEMKCHP